MRSTLLAQRRPADLSAPRTAPYNAAGYLTGLPSPYSPDHFVHPDVVYVPAGLHGYNYWMGVTPYPDGDNGRENPSILASNNGIDWVVPPGLTNPVAPNTGGYNSDTDLVIDPADNTTMHLIYRRVGGTEQIFKRSSVNGVTWSGPTMLWEGAAASDQEISPAVIWDGTQWVAYVVDASRVGSPIKRRTCATLTGTWSTPTDITYTNPIAGPGITWDPWHIDCIHLPGGRFGMIINEAQSINPIRGLRLASSSDGINWTPASTQVIAAGASSWDDSPYRATGVIRPSGDLFRMWYSAYSASTVWRVGYTEIPAADTARYFPT